MRHFEGTRVLVTGAARGMGLAIARRFARAGAEAVLTDLDAEALAEARAALGAERLGCRTYTLDVTRPDEVLAVRDRLHAEAGGAWEPMVTVSVSWSETCELVGVEAVTVLVFTICPAVTSCSVTV